MKRYLFLIILVNLTISDSLLGQTYQTYTLYTPLGRAIECRLYNQELTEVEVLQRDESAATTYPRAVLLAHSSRSYNSNGYAWAMSRGWGPCWIEKETATGGDNIATFYTNDYYKEVTGTVLEDIAHVVYYYNSGQSALYDPNFPNLYQSKWVDGPVMRHEPSYGPWGSMGSRKYYSVKGQYYTLYGGDWETYVGSTHTYTAPVPGGNSTTIRYEWVVYDNKGNNTGYSISSSANVATVTFTSVGVYQLVCEYYSTVTGEKLGEGFLEVFVDL